MNKLITILDRIIEVVIAVLIVAMVASNFWQVFTRFALNNAASWTEEFMRYALIWLTMLGVPYAYGKSQHLAISFVTNSLSKKEQAVDKIFVDIVVLLISVFVMIVGGCMVTANAAGQISPALKMPMQLYYAGVPLCGILMLIYSVPKFKEDIKALSAKEAA